MQKKKKEYGFFQKACVQIVYFVKLFYWACAGDGSNDSEWERKPFRGYLWAGHWTAAASSCRGAERLWREYLRPVCPGPKKRTIYLFVSWHFLIGSALLCYSKCVHVKEWVSYFSHLGSYVCINRRPLFDLTCTRDFRGLNLKEPETFIPGHKWA